jgi:hypothetical protein
MAMTRARRVDEARTEAVEWLRVTEAAARVRRSYGQMLRLCLIGSVVSRRTTTGKLEILASSLATIGPE